MVLHSIKRSALVVLVAGWVLGWGGVAHAAPGDIETIVGTGVPGYSGDSGPAASAQIQGPGGVFAHASGAIYVADYSGHRVRKVDSSGVITTIAGTGAPGYSGDGGPAASAQLSNPEGVFVDAVGNVYIADGNNHAIRKIDSSGVISTVAGMGVAGYLGDGGAATSAQLNYVEGVFVDAAGVIHIADAGNNAIRKVDSAGVISTIAGTGVAGYSGDGGAATSAQLNYVEDVFLDALGAVYIVDGNNHAIRKVDSSGIISTIAGTGVAGYSGDGGAATSAQLRNPEGISIDAMGAIYITDKNNHAVRKVDSSGVMSTIAGTGVAGYSGDGGAAASAQLNIPAGISVDASGNIYIADYANARVRKITSPTPVQLAVGDITTIAGTGISGYSGDGSTGSTAQLSHPFDLSVDALGNIYIADQANHRIRKVNSSGVISTIAGNGSQGYSGDGGAATTAQLNYPRGVYVDALGNIYIADSGNDRIRKVDSSGVISTVAGDGNGGFGGDGGLATSAQLRFPHGVSVDASGSIYIADQDNSRIRKVDSSGVISTVAGDGGFGYSGDGGSATNAQLGAPGNVLVDGLGNIYIADQGNHRIRKVDSSGVISTVAGNGSQGYSGDGGLAASAQLNNPHGVAVDGVGNIYIADRDNMRVRKIIAPAPVQLAVGDITTIAGTGISGYSGDGGSASTAQFALPHGVFADGAGNQYIADLNNHRIRKIDSAGVITTVAGTGVAGYFGDGGQATSAQLNEPYGVFADGTGQIYIAERLNHTIRKVDSSGVISTVVGTGAPGYSGDGGAATSAQLSYPEAVFVDGTGQIFIADHSNHVIRKVDASGNISTIAGTGVAGSAGNADIGTNVQLNRPTGVAVDAIGNVYLSERFNHRVRKINTGGVIFTIAGTGVAGYSGDGGAALSAQLSHPSDVSLDGAGNVYIADHNNHVVRKVDSAGNISTVAGTNVAGYSGDGGPALSAQLDNPAGVSVGATGDIYITDSNNHRVRKVVASVPPTIVDIVAPDLTALYNQTLIVPISITDASGLVSAEVFVEYDTALATLDSVSSLGTVTQGWSASSNIEAGTGSLETVKIALATNVSSATGAATLIHLHFTVNDVRTPLASPLIITHALLNDGTPAHTATDGSITLVGNDALATLSVSSVIPRDPVTFTIIDIDEDLDGTGGTDQMIATVSNGLQVETLTLNEMATPGEFVGTIGTMFSTSSTAALKSGDGIVQASAGDQIVFSATDQLLSDGSGPSAIIGLVDVIGGADGVVAATLVTQPGDPVYIQVTDADLNVNSSGAETASVTVTNSRTAQSVSVVLTEVDVDDEVFFGSLATVPGAGTATEMGSAEDDVLTVTYDDVVTLVGSQVDRTALDDVIDPWGDADDNESLQAFDAARVLLYLLNPVANPIDVQASNVDITPVTSGILAFDAALILQKRVGLISSFPVQDPTSTNHPQGTAASAKVTPLLPSLSLVAGDGYVSLVADQRDEIVSGDVLLEGVEGRVVMGDEYGDFLTAHKVTDEGTRIVFAGAESVRGSGELLRVYGVGPQGARLVRAAFNNTVESAATTDVAVVVPQTYALHANMPNPFNPSTSISFALPEAGVVELVVYDALGQTVRTLVSSSLSAGRHAIEWNGRDGRGVQVSSGVYFYRLEAGAFSEVRRMMLIK